MHDLATFPRQLNRLTFCLRDKRAWEDPYQTPDATSRLFIKLPLNESQPLKCAGTVAPVASVCLRQTPAWRHWTCSLCQASGRSGQLGPGVVLAFISNERLDKTERH